MTKVSREEQVKLEQGMKIRFIDELPEYEVKRVHTGRDPLLVLSLAEGARRLPGVPDSFRIESEFSVGRQSGNNLTITGYDKLSRKHGVIHFDAESKNWRYTQFGLNSTNITHSTKKVEVIRPATGAETQYDEPPTMPNAVNPQAVIPAAQMQVLTIENGTTFQFDRAMPTYEAKVTGSGTNSELVLTRLGDAGGSNAHYPSKIKVGTRRQVTLGRGTTPDKVVLPNPGISAEHATISWDEESHTFLYRQIGKQPPVVRMPPTTLEAMQARFKHLTMTADQASKQLDEIQALDGQVRYERDTLDRVQQLEVPTQAGGYQAGNPTAHSQKGYELWLRAYELLHRESLAHQDSKTLTRMADAFATMSDDAQQLLRIDNKGLLVVPSPPRLDDLRFNPDAPQDGAYRRRAAMKQYVESKAEELEQKKELYLVTGYDRHHTVTRIRKEGDKYLVATFNAGSGAQRTGDGVHVQGMEERYLKPLVKPEDFIWMVSERKMWAKANRSDVGGLLDYAIDDAQDSRLHRMREVPSQQKRNCTTRSNREVLRDELTPETFRNVYAFVSDPELCDPDDLLKALEVKRAAVAKIYQQAQGETQDMVRVPPSLPSSVSWSGRQPPRDRTGRTAEEPAPAGRGR